MRIKTDGRKEAEKHYYHRNATVSDFRYAYILGSGDFGVSVHGTPDNYTYHIEKMIFGGMTMNRIPPAIIPQAWRISEKE